MLHYRKVGGLHHWRIGRLGGSFYMKGREARDAKPASLLATTAMMVITIVPPGIAAGYYGAALIFG